MENESNLSLLESIQIHPLMRKRYERIDLLVKMAQDEKIELDQKKMTVFVQGKLPKLSERSAKDYARGIVSIIKQNGSENFVQKST